MTKNELIEYLLNGKGRGIPGDEPVFLFRGQDRLAAAAVKNWAVHASFSGVNKEKIRGAEADAERMARWPNQKLPD